MILKYNQKNKGNSRFLRSHQTDAEALLWSRLRRKQLKGIQFYLQKPIGNVIVDFFAPTAKLVIELDGGQHFTDAYIKKDEKRDSYLKLLDLKVLRFDNLQVLQSLEIVLAVIFAELP